MKVTNVHILGLLALWIVSVGTTWYVKEDGTGDAPAIQAAIDSTNAGDVVLVGPGTYLEEIHPVSDITIRSELGAEVTTIDANGDRNFCLVDQVGVANLAIEGLTFAGVRNGYGNECGLAPVWLQGEARLLGCVVEDNSCAEGSAPIVVWGNAVVEECTVRNNFSGYSCPSQEPHPRATNA